MKKIVKSTLLSLSDERQTKFTNSLKKAQQHNFLSQSGDAPMQVGIPSTTYGKSPTSKSVVTKHFNDLRKLLQNAIKIKHQ